MNNRQLIPWILWAAIVIGLIFLYATLHRATAIRASDGIPLLPLFPFLVSIIIRIVILPRQTSLTRAFPIFVVGLATAEGCGILGIILYSGTDALIYFSISLLALLAYAPRFMAKLQ